MGTPLRRARLATFGYFGLNGFALGMWVVHIPLVEQRTGVSHAVLGRLLLLLGAGAFLGMRLAGRLTDRLGARAVVPAGAVLLSAALVLPGLARGTWSLAGALFVLGFWNGCLDVSMNTHAVQVEHAYRRPVMSAFHAVFSLGGVLAAGAGAVALGRGWGAVPTLAATGAVGLATALLAAPGLLPRERPVTPAGYDPSRATASAPLVPGGPQAGKRRWGGRIPLPGALALLAFMLMLSEGVANDWSALDLHDVLGTSTGTAALAYGAFSTAMTAGRLLTDRGAARVGPVAVVRYGAALAAAGLALVVVTPWVLPALAGWTAFGVGLSGCVPQVFSAAGRRDPAAAGVQVSRVASLGYLGMLAGPTVIGALTRFVPLNVAFVLPVLLCGAGAAAARVLRLRADPGLTPGPHGPHGRDGTTTTAVS